MIQLARRGSTKWLTRSGSHARQSSPSTLKVAERHSTTRGGGRWPAPVLLLCQGWARFECVEDDADKQSFEAADRFSFAFAFGLFAFEVGACAGVVAGLRDRDPVERGVELPVAAAVEPVALTFA